MKLTIIGDIFPANLGYNAGFGVASQFINHKGEPWKKSINELLFGADIVFGNLESPLLKDKKYCDQNNFCGVANFVDFLNEYKIKIVSIANNHILEQGIEGFNSTC